MDRIAALRAFVRLVDRGSFTAVARELRVKQSTVSKWLAALEDEVGAQLLDRTTRAQRVTDAGRQFYEHAAGIVLAYDGAVADMRQADASLRGRLRINVPVVFGRLFVLPTVIQFLKRHERIEIDLVLSDRYVNPVDEGFDVVVRIGVPVDSSLRSHPLGQSCRRLLASPEYLGVYGHPTAPRALEQHQCLVHTEPGASAVWSFKRGGKSYRASVRGRVSADNSEATLALARSGLGICLLASWLVEDDVRAGRLVPLLEDYQPPPAPIRALTPPGRQIPPRVRAFIDDLRGGIELALRSRAGPTNP